MKDEKTKEREIRGLAACAGALGLKNGLVITKDVERAETIGGIKLQFTPLFGSGFFFISGKSVFFAASEEQ